MIETNQTPIMSVAFLAGYGDGHYGGMRDVAAKADYDDTLIDEDTSDYCLGFKWGYADGYSGVEPLDMQFEAIETANGDMEYYVTHENKRIQIF